MRASCARCGLNVVVTQTGPSAITFETKPHEVLEEWCPFIVGLTESERCKPRDEVCPYLMISIRDRIKELVDRG